MPRKAAAKSIITTATRKLLTQTIEDHIPDVLDLATKRLASVLKLPLKDAIRESIRLVIFLHTINPKLQRVFIKEVWREERLSKVRGAQHYFTQLVLKNLKTRNERVRPKNIEAAVFILVHAVEAAIHAAVIERPELLKNPQFADELTDLVVRYLVD